MSKATVADVLAGKYPIGSSIQVQGWIRTKRDSKAGLSFLAVHDGSCFDPVQVVAVNSLANYDDVLKLTTACSVTATGTYWSGYKSTKLFISSGPSLFPRARLLLGKHPNFNRLRY